MINTPTLALACSLLSFSVSLEMSPKWCSLLWGDSLWLSSTSSLSSPLLLSLERWSELISSSDVIGENDFHESSLSLEESSESAVSLPFDLIPNQGAWCVFYCKRNVYTYKIQRLYVLFYHCQLHRQEENLFTLSSWPIPILSNNNHW